MLRSRPRPLGFIEPALPIGADKPPSGAGWVHEIKFDGFRLFARRRGGVGARLLTRNGHDWTDRYPSVRDTLMAPKVMSCLIDGEVVVCDEHGVANFNRLRYGQRVKPEAVLYGFDLLALEGEDLRGMSIEMRKRKLADLLDSAKPGLQISEHLHGDGSDIFLHACQLGCEGIVSKRLGSRYSSGRTDNWIKVKNPAAPAVKREAEEEWGKRR